MLRPCSSTLSAVALLLLGIVALVFADQWSPIPIDSVLETRYDQGATRVGGSLLLFGGLVGLKPPYYEVANDTWAYRLLPHASPKWQPLAAQPLSAPPGRHGHTLAYGDVCGGGVPSVYLFGGNLGSTPTDTSRLSNELFRFQADAGRWVPVPVASRVSPAPRFGHSATMLTLADNTTVMAVFAGRAATDMLDDLWYLRCACGSGSSGDLCAYRWQFVGFGHPHNTWCWSRFYHGAAAIGAGDAMVVYGGAYAPNATSSPASMQVLGDVWLFNTTAKLWTYLNITSSANAGMRYGHALAAVDHQSVAVFGGINEAGAYLNDLWLLWPPPSSLPSPPSSSSSATTPSGWSWQQVFARGQKPARRMRASFEFLGGSWHTKNATLLLFGGRDGPFTYNGTTSHSPTISLSLTD